MGEQWTIIQPCKGKLGTCHSLAGLCTHYVKGDKPTTKCAIPVVQGSSSHQDHTDKAGCGGALGELEWERGVSI